MTDQLRAASVLLVGGTVALGTWLAGAASDITVLTVFASGLAAGELVQLRPENRAPLPLSFAVMTVVATVDPWQVLAIVPCAAVLGATLRQDAGGLSSRALLVAERCAEAFSAAAVYQVVAALDAGGDRFIDLGALTLAALVPIVVADLVWYVKHRSIAPLAARGADVAVVTSGILMAVGYQGIAGKGELGLWGPVLFSIPLIAAWYSFELLGSTRRSFEQTIEALAAAPELGGLVREGHADRVAELAVGIGRSLSVPPGDLDHLHTAALLHHLGTVCLDEPEDGSQVDPGDVAVAGANMLRASEVLAPAGDIVAAEPLLHRPPDASEPPAAALGGMILKVASAYDELTEGDDVHAAWAVEALYTGPGYVYDGRVLGALERVLVRRGALAGR